MTLLLHITPQLPPAVCGVGDYATLVGGRIEALFPGVRCGYVAAKDLTKSSGPGIVAQHGSVAPRGTIAPALWNALANERDRLSLSDNPTPVPPAASAVPLTLHDPLTTDPLTTDPLTPDPLTTAPLSPVLLLHYSGYGYSPDGAPEWLADALEDRPAAWRTARVVTFFHELYATGWPWRRAFWQSNRQRRVAERIARASDALMTNRAQSARWLESVTGRPAGSVPHLPVPSNVGEPESVPAYEERPPHAVVFGGAGHKRKFLTGRGARRTAQTCRDLGITRLTDIGARIPLDRRPFDQAGVEVVQTGYLPKEAVSEILLEARVGLYSYFPDYLEKSGVLAAYFSHGLAVLGDESVEADLLSLMHHKSGKGIANDAARRAQIATELGRRSDIANHARALACLADARTFEEVCD